MALSRVKKVKESLSQTGKVAVKKYMDITNRTPFALTTSQLLTRLNISRSTIYRLVKAGKLTPLPLFKRNKLFSYEQIAEVFKTPKK